MKENKLSRGAKGIQTINRFIKLINEMPEDVQQGFYRQMASKLKEPNEEWIEEKVREAWNLWWYKASGKYATDFNGTIRFDFQGVKNLIRNLQLPMRKPKKIDEDIINRYKILFHDASPSKIEQLIRKLIQEVTK